MAAHASESRSGTRNWSRVVLVLCLCVIAGLGVERWRGVRMLRRWSAQTQALSPQKLWPDATESSRQYMVQLHLVSSQVRDSLKSYAGAIPGTIGCGPGVARRGSQEPALNLHSAHDPTRTWEGLERALRDATPALRNLRQLMNEVPTGLDYDIHEALARFSPGYPAGVGGAAQYLQTAAIFELHQGNLPGALENLLALGRVPKVRAKDPSLVSYMVRVALLDLFEDACWDALQADGWNDQQLAALQQVCQDAPQLAELPQVFRATQATQLHDIQWFRSHSYGNWQRLHEEIYRSFGRTSETLRGSKGAYAFNCYVRHPAWSVVWADQELALYLQDTEPVYVAIQNAVRRSSWQELRDDLEMVRVRYLPPQSSWRFYRSLPLSDPLSAPPHKPAPRNAWPYVDFSKAWQASFRNLTHHNLLLAAIALKRYQLRHGHLPSVLSGLCPEFLNAVPIDLMDGKPLRYRLNPDNTFTLYSVGLDGHDDDGDPLPKNPSKSDKFDSFNGRDMVWPRVQL